jgi:hypothetical protein
LIENKIILETFYFINTYLIDTQMNKRRAHLFNDISFVQYVYLAYYRFFIIIKKHIAYTQIDKPVFDYKLLVENSFYDIILFYSRNNLFVLNVQVNYSKISYYDY